MRPVFALFPCLLTAACLPLSSPGPEVSVQIRVSGPGYVHVEPGSQECTSCNLRVAHGTELTLTAVADVANGFRNWDVGGCTDEVCTLTANQPSTATARFFEQGDVLFATAYDDVTPPLPHLSVFTASNDDIVVVGQFGSEIDLGGGPLTGTGTENIFRAEFGQDGVASSIAELASGDKLFSQASLNAAGELFVGGWFEGTADFGTGTLTSGVPGSLFIAKYDTSNTLAWVNQFDFVQMQEQDHIGVHATSDGGVLLRVNYEDGDFDFGGGQILPGPLGLGSALGRFDGSGAFVWQHNFGTATSTNLITALDASDNVLIAGLFGGVLILDPGVVEPGSLGGSFMLARLNSDGSYDSHKQLNTGAITIRSIQQDTAGAIFLNAYVEQFIDFGGGLLQNTGTLYQPALVRFQTDFTHDWSWIADGVGWGVFHHLEVANDEILATGVVSDRLNLGVYSLDANGFSDAVVSRFDATTGEALWARTYGASNADSGYRTHPLANGDALLFGAFRSSTQLDDITLNGDAVELTQFLGTLLQASP